MKAGEREQGNLEAREQNARAGDAQIQSKTAPGNCLGELWQSLAALELCQWVAAWWKENKNQNDPPCCFQSCVTAPVGSSLCSCAGECPLHPRKPGVNTLKAKSMRWTKPGGALPHTETKDGRQTGGKWCPGRGRDMGVFHLHLQED